MLELSRRQDCFYVTFSVAPKAGLLLGRRFMLTDRAAGELCERLTSHPRRMVALQDDDFFNGFRSSS